ncbi:glycosyl hydrolase [Pseudonocardia sp. N23]|uniref:glycosyl hydrolase n=1 Tax=Pseudonocardia sp. N23 TaxID=1987376 RepID=UPI000BFB1AF9|nr:glycosyl hydrolase [Pseudonocardia sp. N23]GAY12868.1 chitinase [Pseudonocardia sp. N23]
MVTAALVGTAALAVTLLAGCSSGPPPAHTADTSAPLRTGSSVTPYVDVSASNPPITAMSDAGAGNDVALSFGLATNGACTPSWGGERAVDDPTLVAQLTTLRDRGGKLTVATGGASGEYLENVCATADELADAYGRLLDATGATQLDVDVEADVPTERVADALHTVQTRRGTAVSLTLQVAGAEEGLDERALDVARTVAAAGVRFSVNPLVMNFPPSGTWSSSMSDAVDAVRSQVATLSPAPGLAVTIMIGQNDTGPVTTLDDARTLAATLPGLGVDDVRFWSLGRDNGGCPGTTKARPDCSGVDQSAFAFTQVFRDAAGAPPATNAATNGRNGS